MLSKDVRKLTKAWERGSFPKHLEWLEIIGIRGWSGQRIDFKFPIVAISGENGMGKSTILQAAAAIYANQDGRSTFASDHFPDTPWETIRGAVIKGSIVEGGNTHTTSIRKPSDRWRGNPERHERPVVFLDLRRTQSIHTRLGYGQVAKAKVKEVNAVGFTADDLRRLSQIIGKTYSSAKQSTTDASIDKKVNVLSVGGTTYSGFHQGAGEATVADLLAAEIPKYALVLIDEIETSLHPRAQRRLLRDLADIAAERLTQFVITTHSPYILEELPPMARLHVMADGQGGRQVVVGASPEFALSKMDEETHPEVEVYVEDDRAKAVIQEIMAREDLTVLSRIVVTPYGSASVGVSLGTMASQKKFRFPSVVFLDGDQPAASGCHLLPGGDAPEVVIFNALQAAGWPDVAEDVHRSHADLVDYAEKAMSGGDHHQWVREVADKLVIGSDELWRAMVRAWVQRCPAEDRKRVAQTITEALA